MCMQNIRESEPPEVEYDFLFYFGRFSIDLLDRPYEII